MRYFENKLQDFVPGTRVEINVEHWKQVILSTARTIVEKMPPTFDNCDGGVYVGCAGVSYMFYYLSTAEPLAEFRDEMLTRGKNYADVALSYTNSKRCRDPQAALLLGGGGVFAVSSLIYHDYGNKDSAKELADKYLALAPICKPVDYLGRGSDELLVGRAGYLFGALLLNRKFGQVVTVEAIHSLCKATILSGRLYSQKNKSPSPLMYHYHNKEYLGAAHGLSGILQVLLCCPDYLKDNPDVEKDVHQAVDFMLDIMQPNGNIASATNKIGSNRRPVSEELVHWCHGASGVVYLFAKAFLYYKDPKYLTACLKCGELAWQKGLLKKGPGICHGVAGSGYVFLLLYRLTADEKHYHRALKFAEFLQTPEFQQGARTPDRPYSLYEGLAGTVCFLADLLQPAKAEFPLFDVFSYGKK